MELFVKVVKYLKLLTLFPKNSQMLDWSQPHHCTYQTYLQNHLQNQLEIFSIYFFIYLKDKNIKFKNVSYPATALLPSFKKITIFTNFIGKVIISFDITLFDNIYLNHNSLHFLYTIWNLWPLIYVQSHFQKVVKFLSHVLTVTSLIVSSQRTSLPSLCYLGYYFQRYGAVVQPRTNGTSKMELFFELTA